MSDQIREAIRAEVGRRGLSAYRLSAMCGGHPNKESVARFLGGKTGMTTANASRILRALGMTIEGGKVL